MKCEFCGDNSEKECCRKCSILLNSKYSMALMEGHAFSLLKGQKINKEESEIIIKKYLEVIGRSKFGK